MIYYHDIESGKLITEKDLFDEYTRRAKEEEDIAIMSFSDYVTNSLTRHNGTLEFFLDDQKPEETFTIHYYKGNDSRPRRCFGYGETAQDAVDHFRRLNPGCTVDGVVMYCHDWQ